MGFLPDIPTTTNRSNKVSRFMRLDEGRPVTVQVLERQATGYWKFWFNDSSGRRVAWAAQDGEMCPISQRNAELRQSDPVNGRNHPDYIKPQRQFAVNVLDVTPMIICGECGGAYFPQEKQKTCDCGASLAGIKPQPLNMVRVLERGQKLFQALETLGTGTPVKDENGDLTGEYIPIVPDPNDPEKNLPLHKFCVQIVRSGQRQQTVTNPIPMPHLPVVDLEEYEDQLYDLPLRPNITYEDLVRVVNRTASLSDIYAAKAADSETFTPDDTGDTDEDKLW